MNAALCEFSICGALEKHLLTYLLTLEEVSSEGRIICQCSCVMSYIHSVEYELYKNITHLVAICFCHEHVESSETERLPSQPHVSGIVYTYLHQTPPIDTASFKRRLKTVLFNRGFAEHM